MSGVSNTQSHFRAGKSVFFTGRGMEKREQDGESIKDILERINNVEELDTNDKMDIIRRRKQEIAEKVKRGETEPSIPIGAASYTMKQWNKMMRSVDKAIDDMQERIRKDEGQYERKVRKKKSGAITEDMLSELLGIDIKTVKFMAEGNLYYQITGEERFVQDNCLYRIEGDGNRTFFITDKSTGYTYRFSEDGCLLQTDKATGRSFLIPGDNLAMSGSIMAADDTLKSMLAQYFGKDELTEGELIGFTFSRNAATGIEIMIPDGMKGKMAHILFQSKADVEAYQKLVRTYRTKYSNLAQSDEMAAFYASIEIEGLCHRTETGILSTNVEGVSYADENNPEKSWSILFEEQSEESYHMLMDMMEEIMQNGKDVRERQEWEYLLSHYDEPRRKM